jgi:glutathione S-transferase
MIEIIGPTVSPFVVKIIAAADYKRLSYTDREHVSIRELSKLNPVTGKIPVVVFDGEVVFDSTLILRRFDQLQPTPALSSEDATIAEFGERLDDLALLLGKPSCFYSDRPSVADFAIYGVFSTGCAEDVTPDFAEQVSQRPALVDWRKRVEEATRLTGGST